MFFTTNNLESKSSNIQEHEKITSLSVNAWAGQGGTPDVFFIGLEDSESSRTITIYSDNPNIEISTNARQWHPAIDFDLTQSKVSDPIYVRAIADLDATEGERIGKLNCDGLLLTVEYFLAEAYQGDTTTPQSERFEGKQTLEVWQQFVEYGEALVIVEYTPLPKPTDEPKSLRQLENLTLRQWVNPLNSIVGFTRRVWHTKGFIGDRDSMMNSMYSLKDFALTMSDTNSVLLPYDFAAFNPTWRKTLVEFSQLTPFQKAYSGTVWTVLRDNHEYALRNITRTGYFQGQILFFRADLVRVHYAGGSAETDFRPWAELLDADWKVIDYVREWSRDTIEDAYDPYLETL